MVMVNADFMLGQRKHDSCYNHYANTDGFLVLHKSESTITQIKRRRSNVAFMLGRHCIG